MIPRSTTLTRARAYKFFLQYWYMIPNLNFLNISVVFAADVRVRYDEFRKTMTATGTSKTIFTVNPGDIL